MKNFFKSIFYFLIHKSFWIQLTIAIALFAGVIYGATNWMKDYTLHGEKIELPNLVGYTVSELDSICEKLDIQYEILDSVYADEYQPGEIIKQIPQAFQYVKQGRTIYININASSPPLIPVPMVINQSRRQAVSILEALGFKIGKFEHIPDICTDCVLEIKYDTIGKIKVGTKLSKGSEVTLVLGQGMSDESIRAPYLHGKTLSEATTILLSSTLNLGALIYEDCENSEDSINAMVYHQNPSFDIKEKIALGTEIDLWLTADTNKIEVLNIDSLIKLQEMRDMGESFKKGSEDFSEDDFSEPDFSE